MRHIPQLDGLRAAAILMVFATHAARIPLLWAGVDLFFVLSGYLITGILLRLKQQPAAGYFRPFYLRRAQRILPPYLLFLILSTAIIHTGWIASLWCILFSANIGLALGKINSLALTPLWSLAVEEQFYLIWPWVVLLCSARTLRRLAISVIVISPLLRAAATPLFHDHLPIYFLSVFRADGLCAGALVAVAQAQQSFNSALFRKRTFIALIVGSMLVFGLLSTLPSFHTSANSILFNSLGYSLISLFFLGMLIFALTLPKGVALAFLSWAPLRYLGRISYSFYLWHVAVLLLLSERIHSTPVVVILGFALTAAIAATSWHVIEAPLLKKGAASFRGQPVMSSRAA